jgi:hypothetical protein
MQEEDYMDFIKEKIELDKLLASTSPKYHEKLTKLLEKKKKIIKKNGLFANFRVKQNKQKN